MEPYQILIFIPFAIATVFYLVLNIISFVSGWRRLSKKYPRTAPPQGTRFDGQSLTLGVMGYNNVLRVYASEEGLDIAPVLFFKIAHPPIFIPWAEIIFIKNSSFIFLKLTLVEIGSPSVARIKFRQQAYEMYRNVII